MHWYAPINHIDLKLHQCNNSILFWTLHLLFIGEVTIGQKFHRCILEFMHRLKRLTRLWGSPVGWIFLREEEERDFERHYISTHVTEKASSSSSSAKFPPIPIMKATSTKRMRQAFYAARSSCLMPASIMWKNIYSWSLFLYRSTWHLAILSKNTHAHKDMLLYLHVALLDSSLNKTPTAPKTTRECALLYRDARRIKKVHHHHQQPRGQKEPPLSSSSGGLSYHNWHRGGFGRRRKGIFLFPLRRGGGQKFGNTGRMRLPRQIKDNNLTRYY